MRQIFFIYLRKIKEKGFLVTSLKITSLCLRLLYVLVFSPWKMLISLLSKTLTVYYDYDICPPTYDSIPYFAAAEIERRKRGLKKIRVIFLIDKKIRIQGHSDGLIDKFWYTWRTQNIVIPSLSLFSFISEYCVVSSWRSLFKEILFSPNIFPFDPFTFKTTHYDHLVKRNAELMPHQSNILTPPYSAKKFVQDWMNNMAKDKKVISITLRLSPYTPERNSNVREWAKFASKYKNDYFIVFIMDTETSMKGYPPELENYYFIDAASWNLPMRAAFYEAFYLNLFTSGGPFALGLYNKNVRFLFFKTVVPGVPTASEEIANKQGFFRDKNFPWATKFQKLVWDQDVYPVIVKEFTAMVKKIEQRADYLQYELSKN